jgi:hypothetical protein
LSLLTTRIKRIKEEIPQLKSGVENLVQAKQVRNLMFEFTPRKELMDSSVALVHNRLTLQILQQRLDIETEMNTQYSKDVLKDYSETAQKWNQEAGPFISNFSQKLTDIATRTSKQILMSSGNFNLDLMKNR